MMDGHADIYAHVADEPVDVEERASVGIAHARDGAVRVGPQERYGAHGGRRRECARGTGVSA